jgi:hypothetical protein
LSLSLRFPHQHPVHASPLPHTRYMLRPAHNTSLRRINTPCIAMRKGPRHTDFKITAIYSPLKKILFYPYYFTLLSYVILQVIFYSMFYFMLYPNKLEEFMSTRSHT